MVNLFDWISSKNEFENKPKIESFVNTEEKPKDDTENNTEEKNNEYKEYYIVLTHYFETTTQQLLKVYLTEEETISVQRYLDEKILELTTRKNYVSMAFRCRNEAGEIISYAMTNIVGISHNLPVLISAENEKEMEEKEKELSVKGKI